MTPQSNDTKSQIIAAIQLMKAVADAIKEAGPQGIVSGHLYATLMGKISANNYQALIAKLQELKIIRMSNNVLYYLPEVK